MSKLGNFVWGIADQLRGVYKPHQYGGVILPFTILRRLDCILEPTRDEVRTLASKYSGGALDVQVKRKTGLRVLQHQSLRLRACCLKIPRVCGQT